MQHQQPMKMANDLSWIVWVGRLGLVLLVFCCNNDTSVIAFSLLPIPPTTSRAVTATSIQNLLSPKQLAMKMSSSTTTTKTNDYKVPLSVNEMIRQVASCIKQAAQDGETKQIVRILLPRDSTSGNFGTYIENSFDSSTSNNNQFLSLDDSNTIQLVPPDESWQGGIMQLYRSAEPTAMEIIRTVVNTMNTNVLPSRITVDRSVDSSTMDGVGLVSTADNLISCWVQPTQENVDEFIDSARDVSNSNSENDDPKQQQKIVLLLNPQWRQVDDVLDTVSKQSDNIFLKSLANFLGGKGNVIQRCNDVGYIPVYTLEGYVCRGTNVRLMQSYASTSSTETTTASQDQSDPQQRSPNNLPSSSSLLWSIFCERDDTESYVQIGTSTVRPTYQEVEAMMTESDIGYKYARDIGLQPKL